MQFFITPGFSKSVCFFVLDLLWEGLVTHSIPNGKDSLLILIRGGLLRGGGCLVFGLRSWNGSTWTQDSEVRDRSQVGGEGKGPEVRSDQNGDCQNGDPEPSVLTETSFTLRFSFRSSFQYRRKRLKDRSGFKSVEPRDWERIPGLVGLEINFNRLRYITMGIV